MTRHLQSALVLTPKAGGADGISAVTRLAAWTLVGAGVDTRVLALDADTRVDLGDGPLPAPVQSADGARLRFLLQGVNAARGTNPDLVVVCHLRMLPVALPLILRGAQGVTFLHGVECWKPLSRRDRQLLMRTDLLLPISACTRSRFLAANPSFATMATRLCPPGVVMLPPPAVEPVPGRALVVGRLWSEERYKGHDAMIDVWPAVRHACPSASLVVVGDGDDRGRLEARVRDEGLTGAIHFTGLISRDALRRQFGEAQVFVLPSSGEGFGIVFLEAMRAARPCVAGNGAPAEIVVDGVTGRVIDPQDREALTATLIGLLNDPGRCRELGRAGRKLVEAEFSDLRFAERFTEALRHARAAC